MKPGEQQILTGDERAGIVKAYSIAVATPPDGSKPGIAVSFIFEGQNQPFIVIFPNHVCKDFSKHFHDARFGYPSTGVWNGEAN